MMNNSLTLDPLRWLLASLALVYGLLAPHLPMWVTLLAVTAGGWRYAAKLGYIRMPRLILLLPIAAIAVVGITLSHGSLLGRDASISLLATMMALKLLESHTRRDATLLVFLAFFLSITSFLFSQSLLAGAYLLLPLTGLVGTLISVNHPVGHLPAKPKLRLAAIMLAQSAPIMLLLFLLFPRIQGPLWGVPEDAYSGMTGLSDHMSPGTISQLSRSDSPAFRVAFDGPTPEASQLYWRGPVLWNFDGASWTAGEQTRNLPTQQVTETRLPTRYTVTLEPHNRRWLFMLDLPATTPSNSTLTHDYQLLSAEPVRLRLRYDGASNLEYRLGDQLDPESRFQALQLPAEGNAKTRAMARVWEKDRSEQIVQRALSMFRDQAFRYTLSPPVLGQDSIDDFLFTTRSGFCEHYAGSFVFLMRAAGIPARVVTGYQGGEINPTDHYLMVRQADAHAWAEVWLENRGWVRVDPTAAVVPQRVESGVATALPAGEPIAPLMRADLQWLRKMYLRWDAVNNRWNQWVLGYDQQRQMALLSRLAGSQVSWQDMIIGLFATVSGAVLAIAGFMLYRKKRIDVLQGMYARFQRKLAKAGVSRHPNEGPLDFGKRAAGLLPKQAKAILDITLNYAHLRYGNIKETHQIEALRHQIRNFRP